MFSDLRAGALLVFLFAAPILQAQTGYVTGTVRDLNYDTPLPAVNVFIQGSPRGTATGANGRFMLGPVATGSYTLVARALGYETLRQEISVAAGDTLVVTLALREQPLEMDEIVVERTTLTGGRRGADALPGSASFLGPRELEAFRYTDVHRVLRSIPGVYVQEEDGFGLRPNIGMRGSGVERSSKITVMEDGILMSPAPYAAPAAYYFPTIGRMQGVEVRKGSSQIKYGPYTTGGALNLISTAIPATLSGKVEVLAGSHDLRTYHAHVGDSFRFGGFLLETYGTQSDGFKILDTRGGTGFDKQDYLAKLQLNTSQNARVYQSLLFKAGRVSELSDETYLGLSEADFALSPFRRYAASQADQMDAEHQQYSLRHVIRPASFVDVTTTLYRTTFDRNWYKLDRVRASDNGRRTAIAAVLDDPQQFAAEYAVLAGATAGNADALEVKANNRRYAAQGVQSIVGLRFATGAATHGVEVGVRLHHDEMDRFQWTDLYGMQNGLMTRTQAGTPGTESNRVESAQALAAFMQYRLEVGRFDITPGLRHENITLKREDYGTSDPARTGSALKARENKVTVWIPGLGVTYRIAPGVDAFGGVHKGFAPPGSQEGARAEESVSYELGARLRRAGLGVQATAFYNDYTNLLGADLAAGGGQGTTDQFNGGEVDVRGLELSLDYDLGLAARTRLSLPFSLAYTYTRSRFGSAFESTFEPWGTVEKGDALPYQPDHQLATRLGARLKNVDVTLGAIYVGRMRTIAGQGGFTPDETVAAHLVFDLAMEVAVMQRARLFGSVRNLTDEVYAAANRPAGLRPGLPRTFVFGVKTSF